MKVTKTIGNLTVEFDGETQKDIFKQLSSLEEVFGEKVCGKCKSENLRYVVRENDGNEFYELRCLDCGAKLAFGAHKQGGGLFPKRKSPDGEWLSDRGWQKWNPKTKSLE